MVSSTPPPPSPDDTWPCRPPVVELGAEELVEEPFFAGLAAPPVGSWENLCSMTEGERVEFTCQQFQRAIDHVKAFPDGEPYRPRPPVPVPPWLAEEIRRIEEDE